eukprot:TRINITY_DN11897_c0_g1_i4.p1 TRINITY_DN11897_c0_g1~~TRINITY_DN11897_c0_g1_i4.p1  ORF type:complete len:142 (-),score=6.59 TRINITY_DN11897_c0_g1_i4:752-1177(-)
MSANARLVRQAKTTVSFIVWVYATSAAAVYVKAWLDLVPLSTVVTFSQAFIGSVLTLLYLVYTKRLQPLNFLGSVPRWDLSWILFGHMIGNLLTNRANISGSASYVNTIKVSHFVGIFKIPVEICFQPSWKSSRESFSTIS